MRNNLLKKGLAVGIIVLFIVAGVFPVAGSMNIEKTLENVTTGSAPDLECKGEIVKKRVGPGSTVTGSFTVENIGEPGSLLDWEVTNWPDFGTNWTFNPSSGEDLTPEDDPITVEVTFTAPTPEWPTYYGNVIKVCAVDNPDDKDLIAVNINVGRNRPVNKLSAFEPLLWWDLWPDFPGRYEPMFDVDDVVMLFGHVE